MKRREAIPTPIPRCGFDTGLFFLLFLLYVWLVIDPRLIHHSIGFFMASMPLIPGRLISIKITLGMRAWAISSPNSPV